MKKLLTIMILMASIMGFSQSHLLSPQDLEKKEYLRNEQVRELQTSPPVIFDKISHSPGFQTPNFRKVIMTPKDQTASGQWIGWNNGIQNNSIGSQEGIEFSVAARFEPSDMEDFVGYSISQISFFPADEAEFTLKIWQGSGLPTEVFSQEVDNYVINQENIFDLVTPVLIDTSQELWIGYHVSIQSFSFPAGVDSGPAIVGKGDMIFFDGAWASMAEEFGLNFNWMINAFVEPLSEPDAPAAPLNFQAIADENGMLSVDLSWTNPTETFDGQPLTSLESISVFRGETLIHTISDPEIGATETFTDTEIDLDGLFVYSVVGENENGAGPSSRVSVFAGQDVPAAPSNITLEAQNGDGFLTWAAPDTGLNGGFTDPTLTSYTVTRLPDSAVVASNITQTSFLDTSIPSIGNYSYKVTSANDQGTGGTAVSNTAFLGGEGILFFETFDYPPGSFPADWQKQGVPHSWAVNHSSNAGGTAPELVMSWNPQFTGMSRVVSPAISTDDHTGLRLTFRQFLNNFSSFNGEILAAEYSIDGGENWQVIWQEEVQSQDIMPDEFSFPFNIPAGSNTIHVGFRFEGNSFNIDYWHIDDVMLEPLFGNNLAGLSVTGNSNPAVGEEFIYTVKVSNLGEFAQTDYTVRLMKEGDVELSSVEGQTIEPGQTLEFELPWTPSQQGATFIYGLVDFAADEFPENNATPNFPVQVQPEGTYIVQVGDGFFDPVNMPFNFFWRTSGAQSIYYPEELGINGGAITALQYSNLFVENLMEKEVKIWIGETTLGDLENEWADFEQLTLVFEGTVDFPQGQNNILINLDTPYIYEGGNLVVYTHRVFEDVFFSSSNRFLATLDQSNVRTRLFSADTPVDPFEPAFANGSFLHPNTTFFFSTEGFGSLEGTVSSNEEPVEDVKVNILSSTASRNTDQQGFYRFASLLPGLYDLEFSKFGYFTQVAEGTEIVADETTVLDINLEAIPQYTVSGMIEGNDGLIPETANISLSGYENYTFTAGPDGMFEITDVFQGEYTLTISSPGYNTFLEENLVIEADTDLGTIILEEMINAPGTLAIDYDNHGAGNALLTWNTASGNTEFRYDNGTATTALATYSDSFNTVLGAAHPNIAELFEMSWVFAPFSQGDTFAETLKVWVFGLGENGIPDRNNLLYSAANVSSLPGVWTTYTFSQPVIAPNGFFIGVASDQFVSLAAEEGEDPDWPFVPNTQFFNANVLEDDFQPIEDYGFPWNFMIRAQGIDYGTIASLKNQEVAHTAISGDPLLPIEFSADFNVESSDKTNGTTKSSKALTGFNVFLDDLEDPVAFTDETEYLFTDLAEGSYTAGVQSVYTTGVSEIITLDFDLVYPVEVTINASTNTGADAQGALIALTNQEDAAYNYSGTIDSDGTLFFGSVRKGTYTLEASLENHQSQLLSDIEIQEDAVIDLVFTEIIDAPSNLMVVTEGLEAGQALFSWNNPTQGWTESFENGQLPENWSQTITNTSSQSGYAATWQITGTIPFSNSIVPQDGDYQAFVMWSFHHQNEWLISPEFVAPAGDLVFWYHGTNGSSFGDQYHVKITTNGGSSWTSLWNATNLPPGVNHYDTPVTIDLSLYAGQDVQLAWHADDGPSGVGLWSSWAIDNITVGGEPMNLKDFTIAGGSETKDSDATKNVLGYNVFLDGNMVAEGVEDTQFLFESVADGNRVAGVQAVYASGVSDIVTIDFLLRETYLLSLVSDPAGSGSLSGAAWYSEGTEVLVNALPNENFEFVSWTNTAGQVISEQSAFLYTMPANDVVLIANFIEIELFNVTFNIDMGGADVFSQFDDVAVTGSMHNWAVLGANHRNQTMAGDHHTMIYTITFALEPGSYSYKYFLNEGQHDHEWEEGPNREIFVNSDMEIFDTWGHMATSIDEISHEMIRTFPNPFNEFINIEGAEAITRVRVTNILGNVVLDKLLTTSRLNTSTLQPGVYLIYLESDNGDTVVRKMIKH